LAELVSSALSSALFASDLVSALFFSDLTCSQLSSDVTCPLKVKVTLRLTVSQSVNLGVETHLGLMTRYLAITV
jgi:hypothetical protein